MVLSVLMNRGELEFKLFSSVTLYSISLQLVLTVGATFRQMDRVKLIRNLRDFDARIWIYLAVILYVATIICVFFLHWPETFKKIDYINNWRIFQRQYQRVTGKYLVLGMRKTSVICIISVSLISIIQYSPFLTGGNPNATFWVAPLILLSSLFVNLVTVPWIIICSAIGTTARLISEQMELHVQACGFGRGEKISKYRELWLQLYRLTRNFGTSMGLTFGGNILAYFAAQVIFFYYTLSKLFTRPADLAMKWGFPIMYSILIFGFCNAAHNACNEVGSNFHCRLQVLEVIYPTKNIEAISQIQRFFNAMARHPAKITVSGFATVNRRLQTALMSALVTYMIVLVQFDMESLETSPFNCTTAGDST